MSFNYFANGDYEIENNLKNIINEGFSDESQEDPYVQKVMPCLSNINGVIQTCSDKELTMPQSTYDGLVQLEKKIMSVKDRFEGKSESDFKDNELNEFRDYIENIDMFNSEVEIITDWNNNLEKANSESSESSDPSTPVNDVVDDYSGKIKEIEDKLYREEKNLTELQKILREEENKETLEKVNEQLNERFTESDRIDEIKENIKQTEERIEQLKKEGELLNEQAIETVEHQNKQNEEDEELSKQMEEEREELQEDNNEVDDEESDILDNYILSAGIVGIIIIILIILYFTFR
tara:strand:+ start:762 stop:1640 length:879 start_codon:yes stop_codon:yes gene_type:complete